MIGGAESFSSIENELEISPAWSFQKTQDYIVNDTYTTLHRNFRNCSFPYFIRRSAIYMYTRFLPGASYVLTYRRWLKLLFPPGSLVMFAASLSEHLVDCAMRRSAESLCCPVLTLFARYRNISLSLCSIDYRNGQRAVTSTFQRKKQR